MWQLIAWHVRQTRRVVALAVVVAALGATAKAQVTTSSSAADPSSVAPQSAVGQTVYEPGDFFLQGSRVYVKVGKTGFGHEHGVVGQLHTGKLQLNATEAAGEIQFDMRSFIADTDSARKYVGLEGVTPPTTQQEVNTNMLGSAVLDTGRFPLASFVVRSATRLPQPSARGLAQYQLQGDFTLHGATQPLQVIAEAEEQGGWIHLRGGFNMLQSSFGITPFSKAFGAVGVADQLTVYGDFWIAKERQVVAAAAAPAAR
jgi:polyisoprenoid-binding protein YceI